MKLRDYSERELADKIKILEKEKQTYLDKDNLNKTFFVRCDGRSFKNFTRGFQKPFDSIFRETMERTMIDLCEEIQGSVLGFTQSDEITIMFKKNSEESDIYFSGKVEKIVSEVAQMLEDKGVKINSFESRNLYGKVCVKEPKLLYEGTERECIRNKWIRKDALDEIFKEKKEA